MKAIIELEGGDIRVVCHFKTQMEKDLFLKACTSQSPQFYAVHNLRVFVGNAVLYSYYPYHSIHGFVDDG